MSLTNEERSTLVSLEMKKARETFEELEILLDAKRWSGAASRLYYAVFHAVSALLIHDGLRVNTHNGSHAVLSLHYIKTGILPAEFGKLYNQLQTMREEGDYNCVYEVGPEELLKRVGPARAFINIIGEMVGN